VKDHVEVTRGSSEEAAFSLAAEAELIAVFHAGRDGDLEQPLPSMRAWPRQSLHGARLT
jgi:hypothetical protein